MFQNRIGQHGLRLVLATFAVILAITGLVAHHDVEIRREQARSQGLSLVRALARIPLEGLVPGDARVGPLDLMRSSLTHSDFVYAMVLSPEGQPLAEVAEAGITAPPADFTDDPTSWIAERRIAVDAGHYLEFSSPVLEAGERVAQVRIAFREASYAVILDGLPLHATLAAAVLLLLPLSFWIIRREIAPLVSASRELAKSIEEKSLAPLEVHATGALREFVDRFNSMASQAESKTLALQEERTGLLASSKVLSYEKSRFEGILETLPEAAIALDETGRASYCNRRVAHFFDSDSADIVGRRPEDWCADEEIVQFLAPYASGRDSRRTRPSQFRLTRATENDRRIEVSAHPIAPEAKAGGTLLLLRDVTAASLAEEAQSELLAHMAHELKSPLNVLSMYSESLIGKRGGDVKFRIEACNAIQDEVDRLNTLVNTLLSIAKIESGRVTIDRQRVRLPEFLKDTVASAERAGRKAQIEFKIDTPSEMQPVYVDKELLRIAVNNLLTNACKYNHPGGTVELSAHESPGELSIRVRDTGIGIAEEDLGHVFEKFFRSHDEVARKRSGHGLGLSLAREIVRLHGGDVQVASQPGEGSEFTLVFKRSAVLFRAEEGGTR